jgi:hypothetical protein
LTAGIPITDDERFILDILTEYVIWDGRYPTPKQPQHMRDHWKNQREVLSDDVKIGNLKARKSNTKLDFKTLQPIWRGFSDAYLAAYN